MEWHTEDSEWPDPEREDLISCPPMTLTCSLTFCKPFITLNLFPHSSAGDIEFTLRGMRGPNKTYMKVFLLMVKTGFLVLPVLGLSWEETEEGEKNLPVIFVRKNTFPGVNIINCVLELDSVKGQLKCISRTPERSELGMGTMNRWFPFQGTHWHGLGPSTCPQNGSSSWNCELEPGHPAHWLVTEQGLYL